MALLILILIWAVPIGAAMVIGAPGLVSRRYRESLGRILMGEDPPRAGRRRHVPLYGNKRRKRP